MQDRIQKIYFELKLADRMSPGRTPWQTLLKRAEVIAAMDPDDPFYLKTPEAIAQA